ncbi:MAG: hypothetical protein AAGA15_16020 [Pseudomonadota bacterium]
MSDDDKREIMYTLGLLEAEQRNMRSDIAHTNGIITKIQEQDKRCITAPALSGSRNLPEAGN